MQSETTVYSKLPAGVNVSVPDCSPAPGVPLLSPEVTWDWLGLPREPGE